MKVDNPSILGSSKFLLHLVSIIKVFIPLFETALQLSKLSSTADSLSLSLLITIFELITQDPDDNKFVDCAIAANASYVVTNDHHFDVLKGLNYPPIDVIKLEEFMKLLQ